MLCHQAGRLGDQRRNVGGCCPFGIAVVQHDGQHRRQFAAFEDVAAADQVLVQQADVGHDAHCHPRVNGALELDQQVQIHPLAVSPHPPDDVISAVAQVVSHIAAGHLFQRGVVQAVQPLVRNKTQHQITHHFRRGEQQFVGGVVVKGHGRDCMVGTRSTAMGA
ncbi:MAG: hypothetical protein AUK51_14525 [Comamonadaceae bacterium CG2_30_59_20]|nr:MAG: hypothetical protein AUK51_14525 [Comamonadaceae bacterium CG2_30_59_20]